MAKDTFDLECKRCNIDFTVNVPAGVFFKPACPGCGLKIHFDADQLQTRPVIEDHSPDTGVKQVRLF